MSVAIRTAVRLQDQDDVNVSLGAGVDEYALCWDNDTAKFVLRAVSAGVTDHGALTGLSDDDHTGYALLAGRSGGQTLYGGTAANEDITIHGTSNATRTTSYVLLQPTAGNVGIGTTAPAFVLHVVSPASEIVSMVESTFSGSSSANMGFKRFSGQDWRLGVNANDDFRLRDETAGNNIFLFENGAPASSFYMTSAGRIGIGTAAPASALHVVLNDATTNAVVNVLTIGHENATVTAAAGFGAGQLFALETSTTTAQNAARIQALWYEATQATRKADLVLTAYDTSEREGLRIRGAGSAAAIGFLGAAPAARIAHVADPAGGGTVDAEARTAINSILATLENFGFHATS